jgi:hypothetical protein
MLRPLALALVAGTLLFASGCDDGSGGVVTVPVSAGGAAVFPGQQVRVDLGVNDPNAPGDWFLVERPDPAILTDNGEDFESDCPDVATVCGGRTYWNFTAVAPGLASALFQQCFGGSVPPDCQDGAATVTFKVVVRDD